MNRARLVMIAGAAAGVLLGAAVWAAVVLRPDASPPITIVADPAPARVDAPSGAPDIVLVIACTLRRDQTTPYGGPETTTPTLARIAEQGTVFDDMVTAAPWTRAASTAILTGHHAVTVGMVEQSEARNDRVLPDQVTTLAEHLRGQGYATVGFTANPNLNAVYGFQQGFDAYGQLEHLWREEMNRLEGPDAVSGLLELLDDVEPGRPAYVQLLLVDAHAPHHTSRSEKAAQRTPDVPAPVVAYRAAVRRLDDAIALLDEGLAQRGRTAENTLFVVVSDHGEGLRWPEHHGLSHGRYLAPSTVAGVWLMRGPGVAAGHRVEGLASQVDVAATVVSAAGLQPMQVPGRDWSAQVAGRSASTDRRTAFSDTWFKKANRAIGYRRDIACQQNFHATRVDVEGGDFQSGCFDRAADPAHARPFVDEQGFEELLAWRQERLAEGASFGDARTVAPSAELDAQLEALGYVNGDETEEPDPDGEGGASDRGAPAPR